MLLSGRAARIREADIRPSEALGIGNAASCGETLGGVNLNQYCLWEGDFINGKANFHRRAAVSRF
jgi:hypothetical protein